MDTPRERGRKRSREVEVGVGEARAEFPELLRIASKGETTYVTRFGKRVGAIVSPELAEAAEAPGAVEIWKRVQQDALQRAKQMGQEFETRLGLDVEGVKDELRLAPPGSRGAEQKIRPDDLDLSKFDPEARARIKAVLDPGDIAPKPAKTKKIQK